MRRDFWKGLERLRQARTALWSDSNWSVTETEEMRLSDSQAMSQSIMWPDLWVGSRTSWERLWLLSNWRMQSVTGIQVVKIEIAQQKKFARAEAVVVKESRKFFVKEWGCEFVLSAGRRSVEAGKDWPGCLKINSTDSKDRAAKCELSRKERRGRRSWKTRKRSKSEARRSQLFAFGFVTMLV